MTKSLLKNALASLNAQGIIVQGLNIDSRLVQPGDIFVALPNHGAQVNRFIQQAIVQGAVAILIDAGCTSQGQAEVPSQIPHWIIPHLSAELAWLAHHVYQAPSSHLKLIGFTGTNGKTSCTHWLAHVLTQTQQTTGIIGTLGHGLYGHLQPDANTTPDTTRLNRALANMRTQGAQYVAIEVSSIGIMEHRIDHVLFDTAVFTNLSQDHLDYHLTMDAYAEAKAMLFRWQGLKTAIVNLDDDFTPTLLPKIKAAHIVGYGIGTRPHILDALFAEDVQTSPRGLTFTLVHGSHRYPVRCPVLGRFNISNILAVLSVIYAKGIGLDEAISALTTLTAPPGRLQRVQIDQDDAPLVLVDYAHTPDALKHALQTLQALTDTPRTLWCVFGCGGNRDATKRPLMGKIAAQHATHVIVTSDNPRHENPDSIINDIFIEPPNNVIRITNRQEAIQHAITRASNNDIVLIAGKGHETYQEIMGVQHPFSDVTEAEQALRLRSPSR